jgi:uncharacterized protein YjdB
MEATFKKLITAFAMMAVTVIFVFGCKPEEPDTPDTPAPPTTVAVTGVSLNKTSLTITEGENETLSATVAPSNATNTGVSWSSSNTGVATVNGGQVTAVKAGTTTITVTTSDGGKTATCSVTVEAKKVPATGVTIDKETVELVEGEIVTLVATVAPENSTEKAVEWSTSDAKVATVEGGKVTAVAQGTATITVKTKDGGKTATCKVTVSAKAVPVEGISFTKENVSVTEGETVLLYVSFTPNNASNKKVTWSSSDKSIATVDTKGNVTGVKTGTATITVKTVDGGKTATCKVTVSTKVIPVEGIAFTKDNVSVVEGETALLYVSFTPNDASNKKVTWTSSNKSVATVDTKGNVTGVKAGTATITVKTNDGGKTATCKVTVTAKSVAVSKVTLNKTTLTLETGSEAVLVATVAPSNATNKKVTWSSSNKGVVTVDQNGKLKAIKAGTATITVTTDDGGKKATCAVTVNNKVIEVTGIQLDKSTVSLMESQTAQLTATITPSNATDQTHTWTSSNTSIATVDNTGKVTAVKAGTATITAKSNNNKTATCSVTVSARYTVKKGSIEMTENYNLTIDLGETVTLMPFDKVNNAEAHIMLESNSITSGNSAVAGVSLMYAGGAGGISAYNGWKITGNKGGSTTVTMRCGSMTRKINVKVKDYTVLYNEKEVTNPMHYIMVAKSEGINFQLYDKTSGKKVQMSIDNKDYFTITSSNHNVATNDNAWTLYGKNIGCMGEGSTNLTFKYNGVTIKTIMLNIDHAYEVHYNYTNDAQKIVGNTYFQWKVASSPWIYFKLYDVVDKKYVAMLENGNPTAQCQKFLIRSSDASVISAYNGYSSAGKCAKALECGESTLTFSYNGRQIGSTKVCVQVKVQLNLGRASSSPVTKLYIPSGGVLLYFWNVTQDKPFKMPMSGFSISVGNTSIISSFKYYDQANDEYCVAMNAVNTGSLKTTSLTVTFNNAFTYSTSQTVTVTTGYQ